MKPRKGFTLIEMILAIVVVAVIVSSLVYANFTELWNERLFWLCRALSTRQTVQAKGQFVLEKSFRVK